MKIKTKQELTPDELAMMHKRAEEWDADDSRFIDDDENKECQHLARACFDSG